MFLLGLQLVCWGCTPVTVFSLVSLKISLLFPLPSNRHHRRCGDCLEGKGENYQVCCVQYCVQQLCTVQCTHIWTVYQCSISEVLQVWLQENTVRYNRSRLSLARCFSPLPSNRHHRSCGDRLEGKGENYQVCSVQYCVPQLCTVRCAHMNRLTVLWIGFCLTGPISLC